MAIYKLTNKFPATEQYGLTSQMRRAAISISSNAAEGKARGTKKDFRHFLNIAFASGAELETQLLIAEKLELSGLKEYTESNALLDEATRMLNTMIRETTQSLKPSSLSSRQAPTNVL